MLTLITLTETFIISDHKKTESNNCFIVNCFEENSHKPCSYFAVPELDIVLGNHAMCTQPTDYSLICQQISE